MEELRKNPYTHILYGYENGGFGDTFVEIEGKLTEILEEGIKNKLAELFTSIFVGNQDEMITLKIEPIRMRLMNKKAIHLKNSNLQTTIKMWSFLIIYRKWRNILCYMINLNLNLGECSCMIIQKKKRSAKE